MKSLNKHCRNTHKKISFDRNENLNLALLQAGLIAVLLYQFYIMKGDQLLFQQEIGVCIGVQINHENQLYIPARFCLSKV
jgi:hypothetical protein